MANLQRQYSCPSGCYSNVPFTCDHMRGGARPKASRGPQLTELELRAALRVPGLPGEAQLVIATALCNIIGAERNRELQRRESVGREIAAAADVVRTIEAVFAGDGAPRPVLTDAWGNRVLIPVHR